MTIYNEKVKPPYSETTFNHWAYWNELKKEQKARKLKGCDDVRIANGVLQMLKIDNTEVFAYELDDDKGWRIAWNGRKCRHCSKELSFNDDLICGYHNLED